LRHVSIRRASWFSGGEQLVHRDERLRSSGSSGKQILLHDVLFGNICGFNDSCGIGVGGIPIQDTIQETNDQERRLAAFYRTRCKLYGSFSFFNF